MTRYSKNVYTIALGILSTVALHAMEQIVATVDQDRAQRMVQLKSLLLQKLPLPQEILRRPFDKAYGNDGSHNYLKFSSDGQYLIEVRPDNIADFTITNMETRQTTCCPIGKESLAKSLHVTCKGHDLIVASYHNIFKINLAQGCVVENFSRKTDGLVQPPQRCDYIDEVVYNSTASHFISNRRFSNKEDSHLFLLCMHDANTGAVKASYKQNGQYATFSPDGRYLAISHSRYIAVRDGITGKPLYDVEQPRLPHRTIAWHPHNCFFVMAACDTTQQAYRTNFAVWDAVKKEEIHTFFDAWNNISQCLFMLFSHDGKYFITGNTCSGYINIRDGKTFKLVDSISAPLLYNSNGDYRMAINSDSTYLVFGAKEQNAPEGTDQDAIVLYDIEEHKIVRTIPVNNLSNLEWRPGTNQFISTSTGSTEVTMWNLFDHRTTF